MDESIEGLYALNPVQRQFVFCRDRISGYYGGVGNGKTLAGCIRVLLLADLYPGNRILVGRLTYPELRDTTQKQLLDIVRLRNGGNLERGDYVESYNKNDNILVLRNGTEIIFRYLENEESILNLNLGAFYVDQAEFIKEEIFTHLLSRLRWWSQEETAKFKAKYKRTPKHFGFITGNPAPGWVDRRFRLGKNPDGETLEIPHKLFEAPTSENKDHLPKGYEEELRRNYSSIWVKRYLEGDWSTFLGQVYQEFQVSLHVIKPFAIPAHWPRFIGWDHGTTNPTSVSWQAVDEQGFVVYYKEYYQVSAVIKNHAEAVKQLCKGDSVTRGEDGESVLVWMDPSVRGNTDADGRDFRQLYLDYGIIGIPANNSVSAGIEKVSSLLHHDPERLFPDWHERGCKKDAQGRILREADKGSPKVFIFETCVALLKELPQYRYKELKLGETKNKYEEPVKHNDHAMDSWRYSSMAIFEQAKSLVEPRKPMVRPDKPFLSMAVEKLLAMDNADGAFHN